MATIEQAVRDPSIRTLAFRLMPDVVQAWGPSSSALQPENRVPPENLIRPPPVADDRHRLQASGASVVPEAKGKISLL